MPPANRHNPTMPFNTIMTTANTVSRANPALSAANDSMMETMSATSITVTAKASTNVPNGSPIRWATTSAWCTAANTLAIKAAPAMTATAPLAPANSMIKSIAQAAAGQTHAHQGMRDGAAIAKGSFQDRASLMGPVMSSLPCGRLPVQQVSVMARPVLSIEVRFSTTVSRRGLLASLRGQRWGCQLDAIRKEGVVSTI